MIRSIASGYFTKPPFWYHHNKRGQIKQLDGIDVVNNINGVEVRKYLPKCHNTNFRNLLEQNYRLHIKVLSLHKKIMHDQTYISIIKDFVDEYLSADINGLATFDIKSLKGNRKYGSCNGGGFDSDNTRLTRAIIALAFDEVWPGLNEKTIEQGVYRGDTINSFHTMFGGPVNGGSFEGIDKFLVDGSLKERVKAFYHLYSTVGNFVPLPNNMVGRISFNTYRGTCKWRDYFDKFLSALYRSLIDKHSQSDAFDKLIDANKGALTVCSTKRGFDEICEELFLQDFLDGNGHVKNLFSSVYWWNQRITREEYINAIVKYLDFCEPFIVNRSKEIIQRLKEILY